MAVTSPRDALEFVRAVVLRHIKRNGMPSHIDSDDLVSAGCVGYVNATQRATGPEGQQLRSYLVIRIIGAVRDYLRREDPMSRDDRAKVKAGKLGEVTAISRDTVNDSSEYEPRQLPTQESDVDTARRYAALNRAAAALPERLQRVLRMRLDGKTLEQVGAELGVTESRACQLEPQMVHLIREHLAKEGRSR